MGGSFFRGIPSCRAGRSLVSWRALTFCCPLYATSLVSFAFVFRLAPGCSSARFSSCLSREEACSHSLSVQQQFFQSGALSRFTFLNLVLNVQRQQWLQLFLLLKADGHKKKKKFLVGLLLPHNNGFILPRVERLYVFFLRLCR